MPAVIPFIIVLLILVAGAVASVKTGKLTLPAGICAFWVGLGIYRGAGGTGLALLAAFFILATLATAHKKKRKAQLEGQKKHPEKRKPGQVFANGGIAALLGLLAFIFPAQKDVLCLMLASALSSATADTLASELGMVYGRNAFNILSFKREAQGLDGVVSIEGTLLGMAGSVVIALIYSATNGFNSYTGIIILAGTVGNLADSFLGASLERRHYLNNDLVNVLNTLIAALVALLIVYCS